MIPTKGGNIREGIPGVSRFRTDEPEGESSMFAMLERVADKRTTYSDSSRRSEQLSCTKFFDPSYGLFYMNFKRFKLISGIYLINLNQHYPE